MGRPIQLLPFQERFIRAIYDNPAGTKRAYLSIGRKNGKSAVIACIALAHIVGPEAVQNSQIVSGARSRKQAALVFKLMAKMIRMSRCSAKGGCSRAMGCRPSCTLRSVICRLLEAEAGSFPG